MIKNLLIMTMCATVAAAGAAPPVAPARCDLVRQMRVDNAGDQRATLAVTLADTVLLVPLKPVIDKDNLALSSFVLDRKTSYGGSCGVLNYTWGPEEEESRDYYVRVTAEANLVTVRVTDKKGSALAVASAPAPSDAGAAAGRPNALAARIDGDALVMDLAEGRQAAARLSSLARGAWRVLPGVSHLDYPVVIEWRCSVDTVRHVYCGCDSTRRTAQFDVFKDNPECTQGTARSVRCAAGLGAEGKTIRILPFESDFSAADLPRIGSMRLKQTIELPLIWK